MPLPKCTKTLAELKAMKKYKSIVGRSKMNKEQLCKAMGYSVAKKSPAKKSPAKKAGGKKSAAKKSAAKKPAAKKPAGTLLGTDPREKIFIYIDDGKVTMKVADINNKMKIVPKSAWSKKLFKPTAEQSKWMSEEQPMSNPTDLSRTPHLRLRTEYLDHILTGNELVKFVGIKPEYHTKMAVIGVFGLSSSSDKGRMVLEISYQPKTED